MKTLFALLALATLNPALSFAEGISDKCDVPATRAKVPALLEEVFAAVGGKVNLASVKTTPVNPEQLLTPHQASLLATSEVTLTTEDGSESETATFASQFSMNYETCTPVFISTGRLD